MMNFRMPLTQQQEQFSIAYVHAVASTAGYSIEEIRVDVDSIDLTIMQFGNGNEYPFYDGLRVQLKCTYKHKPQDGHLPFPLKIKNYDDLRRESAYPRILVVVYTPEEVDKWVLHSSSSLALHYCGYWVSLRGMPATDNKTAITIPIPIKQEFNVSQLNELMCLIAKGEKP